MKTLKVPVVVYELLLEKSKKSTINMHGSKMSVRCFLHKTLDRANWLIFYGLFDFMSVYVSRHLQIKIECSFKSDLCLNFLKG